MFSFFNESPFTSASPFTSNIHSREFDPFRNFQQIHRSINDFFNNTSRLMFSNFDRLHSTLREHNNVIYNGNSGTVPLNNHRLQWYDSNLRRPTLQASPPQIMRHASDALDQLPTSIVHVNPSKPSSTSHMKSEISETTITSEDKLSIETKNNDKNQVSEDAPSCYSFVMDRKHERPFHHLFNLQPLQVSLTSRKPECEICLGEYKSGVRLRHLPCGHAFHAKCIDTWLGSADTCPKCRKNIVAGLRRLNNQHIQNQRRRTLSEITPTRFENSTASSGNVANNFTSNNLRRTGVVERVHAQTRSSLLRNQLAERRRIANSASTGSPPISLTTRPPSRLSSLNRRTPLSRTIANSNQIKLSPLPMSIPKKQLINDVKSSHPSPDQLPICKDFNNASVFPTELERGRCPSTSKNQIDESLQARRNAVDAAMRRTISNKKSAENPGEVTEEFCS